MFMKNYLVMKLNKTFALHIFENDINKAVDNFELEKDRKI